LVVSGYPANEVGNGQIPGRDEVSGSCFVATQNGVTPSHDQRGKIWKRDAKAALGALPRPHHPGSASDPWSRVAHWAWDAKQRESWWQAADL